MGRVRHLDIRLYPHEPERQFATQADSLYWFSKHTDKEHQKYEVMAVVCKGAPHGPGIVYAVPYFHIEKKRIRWFCRSMCQHAQRTAYSIKKEEQPTVSEFILTQDELVELLAQLKNIDLRWPQSYVIPS